MKTYNLLHIVGAIAFTMLVTATVTYSLLLGHINDLRNKLNAAEAVIEEVERDRPDYVLDCLSEGDAYQIYITGEN